MNYCAKHEKHYSVSCPYCTMEAVNQSSNPPVGSKVRYVRMGLEDHNDADSAGRLGKFVGQLRRHHRDLAPHVKARRTAKLSQKATNEIERLRTGLYRLAELMRSAFMQLLGGPMRKKCNHCEAVFFVTADPNPHEGFFIALDVLDEHDGEELARYRMKLIGAKPATCCPECGMITPD